MKKYKITFLILCSAISIAFYSSRTPNEYIGKHQTRFAIVSPDVQTIKSLNRMLANKIIDIPDLEINLICYVRDKDRHENLKAFLKVNNYPYIKLQEIDGDLNKDNIFQENSCSKEFYRIFKNTNGILFF